ncbi:hypothetical protein GOODEAATRI_012694, partial [Goodea atripinnis]
LHYNGRSHLRRVRQRQAGEARQQAAGALHRSLPQATGFNSQSAGQTQTTGLNGILSVSNTTAGETKATHLSTTPSMLRLLAC